MTSRTNTRPKWPFHLIATVVVLVLAALLVPISSSAHKHKGDANKHKIDGVTAKVKHGTLEVKGSNRADALALRLSAKDPDQIQVDVGDDGSADFLFAREDVLAIDVKTGNGDDSVRVDDTNGGFTDAIETTIAGGNGDDSLNGGLGAEAFDGGNGNDLVDGGKGNDTASLGNGNDTFQWDPGEGSDVIDGQNGSDTMLFNGADVDENVTMTANGGRLTFFRDVGKVTMDTDDVETVDFNALGGKDNVTVNDLTGTDVTQTKIDLAGALDPGAGDGADDSVIVNGTNGDDTISIDGSRSGVDVTGLATAVSIRHEEPTDSLSVNTFAGKNSVTVNGVAGLLQLLVDGVRF
jgi:Ca2+-binding RTX toxin-like protein